MSDSITPTGEALEDLDDAELTEDEVLDGLEYDGPEEDISDEETSDEEFPADSTDNTDWSD